MQPPEMTPTAVPPALLTDLYQLTMARGHMAADRLSAEGTFHLYFRRAPFGGAFALLSGVEEAIQELGGFGFGHEALEWLGSSGALPAPFGAEFLDVLGGRPFQVSIDSMRDGDLVLPHVPIARVTGPLWQAQLVETFLLNRIGFETLVATKAARVAHAAEGRPFLEFGARRAQGVSASLGAARAAWIGGAAGTSNVAAAERYGIPVRGTHAHAWVQSFAGTGTNSESELRAFRAFADSMPKGCVLLVDTYDTALGIENAIRVAGEMRARGEELAGIRLDSGDLGELSRMARTVLDSAGFPNVSIVASDDLNEHKIAALLQGGAPIDTFGVGTSLVTGGTQSALGVVYKLGAVRESNAEPWKPVMKISGGSSKLSLPGRLEARKVMEEGPAGSTLTGHSIHLESEELAGESLLRPAMVKGEPLPEAAPNLAAARERARANLAQLPSAARDLENPAELRTVLSDPLVKLRQELSRP